MRRRRAFTLVELLVVIAIIALLLSVLMPALGKARRMARTVIDATNVKTMSQGTFLYSQAYKDKFPLQGGIPLWPQQIAAFINREKKNDNGTALAKEKWMMCPEAPKAVPAYYVDNDQFTNKQYGGPRNAWGWAGESGYAMNLWLCPFANDKDPVTGRSPSEISARQPGIWPYYWQTGKMPNVPGNVGMYGDGRWVMLAPVAGDLTVRKKDVEGLWPQASFGGGLDGFVINRHDMAINVGFVGGQVEKVALPKLGTIRWTQKFVKPGKITIVQ
jgi:prepilin-type N-terminal cleavage/methylation domain-containing protein